MKLLFLLLPILAFSQKTITVVMDFEVVDYKLIKGDTIWICKDKKQIRKTKDSIYIYGTRQYLKLKK